MKGMKAIALWSPVGGLEYMVRNVWKLNSFLGLVSVKHKTQFEYYKNSVFALQIFIHVPFQIGKWNVVCTAIIIVSTAFI
jgi:hypothetical protein